MLLKLFKQLYQDYPSINREAKNSTSSYFGNLIKIFLDKTIKTIGYIWHFFFRNKKYDVKLNKFGNYKFLPDNISQNFIIYSCGIGENISFDAELERPYFIFNANFFNVFSYLITRRKLHNRLIKEGYDIVELQANELLAINLNK
jgi:hypothetical protein